MKNRCLIFSRVSTKKQDTSRQCEQLKDYCNSMGYTVVATINEIVSGTVKNSDRDGIQQLLEYSKSGQIDRIIVMELSRLSRSPSQTLLLLEQLELMSVSLFVYNLKVETLLENGKRNPVSQILFSIISEFNRAERDCISERVSSGILNYKKKHGTWGRRVNSCKATSAFLKENSKVVKLLNQGYTIRHIATLADRSVNTVLKVKRLITMFSEPLNSSQIA